MFQLLKMIALSAYFYSTPCFGANSLSTMTLEEKVGQLLMVHFHGEVANEEARTLIQETKVGGIIYYNWSNGLTSSKQVQALSIGLQKLTKENRAQIPLLIAVDQEGGIITRLDKGFTQFPGNKALGMTDDPTLAEAAALAMGLELKAVGVNMNLAPVVDVNSNPRNPVIGARSFGDNPETVFAFGKMALQGYKKAQIIATLKHFPGYGDVTVDPHEDLPIVRKTQKELEKVELLPFTRLASSADAIMTAHVLVPAFDTENCSTLSEKTLTYLKETIGFKGVIVADSLVMEGVFQKCHTVDEASIQALHAGCDILILGGKLLIGEHTGFELTVADVQRIHGSIVNAIKSGRISEERLNQAVKKILKLKERYLTSKSETQQLINTANHRAIAQKIGSLALKNSASQNASKIGEKIWKNECAGTIEGLTHWKKGEDFASVGIGHFIWYSADKRERFEETFPSLLQFLQKEGATFPPSLKTTSACPWNSREEFYQKSQSSEMKSLRQFLFVTRNLQAIFIANRLEKAFPQMVEKCSQHEKDKITTIFYRLALEANGLYALIDYLNFKGSGTSSSETYKGQGWGLLQVLQRIPVSSRKPIADFVKEAKAILTQRVENSPPERHEEQWLKGWFNRLDSYLEP